MTWGRSIVGLVAVLAGLGAAPARADELEVDLSVKIAPVITVPKQRARVVPIGIKAFLKA